MAVRLVITFTTAPGRGNDLENGRCVKRGEPPHAGYTDSTGMHVSIGVQREDETQPFDSPGDRDFALGCMARGIAALCIEQRSFGERHEQAQKKVSAHGCHDAAMQALLVGKTLIGERVYDVERGIDYLAARGDADMRRVGVWRSPCHLARSAPFVIQ